MVPIHILVLYLTFNIAYSKPVQHHRERRASGCGPSHVLSSDYGHLSSLEVFRFDYPPNLDCAWDLFAPSGKKIRLEFRHFDLEWTERCSGDYISISNERDITLIKGCGRQLQNQVFLTDLNYLKIEFHSDAFVQRTGFDVIYSMYNSTGGTGGRCSLEPVMVQAHVGVVGTISSPNWPEQYHAHSICCWIIVAAPNQVIRYWFTPPFRIEATSHCMSGSLVQLFDMVDPEHVQMLAYCGDNFPPGGDTQGYMLKVLFTSNDTSQGEGFQLTYKAVNKDNATTGDLEFELFAETTPQTLNTPNYPGDYDNDVKIKWTIKTPNDLKIKYEFVNEFGIELTEFCTADFLQIHTPTYQSPQFCGNVSHLKTRSQTAFENTAPCLAS